MPFDLLLLGAAGYGGGELLRLLLDHPQIGHIQAVSRSHAGQPIHSAHPALRGFMTGTFQGAPDWNLLAQSPHPVVVSAQSHGDLARQLPELEATWNRLGMAERMILVDLSGDYRLEDAAVFARAYGSTHADPGNLGRFVYGCPEASRPALQGARRVANPGCFATALNLALFPLAGLPIPYVAVSAATGSSGSGAKASSGTHHPERSGDYRAYKALRHQHGAEVRQFLSKAGAPDLHLAFVPHSAPMVRGIFATAQFECPTSCNATEIRARYEACYADAPFVDLVESPRVAAVVGSNRVELAIHDDGRSIAILVALDNLIKGMAGQAIQNLNLALGFDERAGLWRPGRWPA